MRMIVEAFRDTLELGLAKPKQVVVGIFLISLSASAAHKFQHC
jgi:hypothetical protein